MNSKQKKRREGGLLLLGILLGGLFGIVSGFWTAIYLEWVKARYPNPDWTTPVIGSSVVLVVVLIFVGYMTIRELESK
jgi:H+/Cl- antiporter ClcA